MPRFMQYDYDGQRFYVTGRSGRWQVARLCKCEEFPTGHRDTLGTFRTVKDVEAFLRSETAPGSD